jgi:hypothetical protein
VKSVDPGLVGRRVLGAAFDPHRSVFGAGGGHQGRDRRRRLPGGPAVALDLPDQPGAGPATVDATLTYDDNATAVLPAATDAVLDLEEVDR